MFFNFDLVGGYKPMSFNFDLVGATNLCLLISI